jgi:hypothetical protein
MISAKVSSYCADFDKEDQQILKPGRDGDNAPRFYFSFIALLFFSKFQKMINKGLLFIPDISGFTDFVSNMEVMHSRHIIRELLELIIDSNELSLEVSEVEGDAVLFFKFGTSPELSSIYSQVEKMFNSFHNHLNTYEENRTCHCKACISAIHLSLKVITHYGEFTRFQVKHFNKLFGKDVIIAHQLLKNDISHSEYWLITNNMLDDLSPGAFANSIQWHNGIKQTEQGEIFFRYAPLSQLIR